MPLQKGDDSYECMVDCQKLKETLPPENIYFYGNLNKRNIIGWDYRRTKRVWKNFGIKKQSEYHDFYVQNNDKTKKNRKIKLRGKNEIRIMNWNW